MTVIVILVAMAAIFLGVLLVSAAFMGPRKTSPLRVGPGSANAHFADSMRTAPPTPFPVDAAPPHDAEPIPSRIEFPLDAYAAGRATQDPITELPIVDAIINEEDEGAAPYENHALEAPFGRDEPADAENQELVASVADRVFDEDVAPPVRDEGIVEEVLVVEAVEDDVAEQDVAEQDVAEQDVAEQDVAEEYVAEVYVAEVDAADEDAADEDAADEDAAEVDAADEDAADEDAADEDEDAESYTRFVVDSPLGFSSHPDREAAKAPIDAPRPDARDGELQELRLSLEASQNELSSLSAARDQALQVVARHEQQILELRTLLGQHEAVQASLQREKQDLAVQLREFQRHNDRLREEVVAAANEREAAVSGEDAAELAQQLDQLRAAYDQASADLSLANETAHQLHQNVMQRDAQIHQLTHDLQQHAQAVDGPDELELERDEAIAGRDAARAELESVQEQLAKTQEGAAEASHRLHNHIRRLQQDLELAHSSSVDTTTLAQERDRFRADLQAAQYELGSVQEQLAQTQAQAAAESDQQADQIRRLEEELETIRQQAASVHALEQERDEVRRELDDAKVELANAQQQISLAEVAAAEEGARLHDHITQLQGELEAARQEAAARSEVEQERDQLVESLSAARVELEDLQQQLSQSQAAAGDEIAGLHQHTAELRGELEAARQDAALGMEIEQERAQLRDELKSARVELDSLRQQLSQTQAAAEEETTRLHDQNVELQAELDASRREAAAAQEVTQHRDQLQGELNAAHADLEDVRRQMSQQQAAVEEQERQCEQLRSDVESARRQAEALSNVEQRLDAVVQERDAARAELAGARTQLAQAQQAADEEIPQLRGRIQELDAQQGRLPELEEALQSARQSLLDQQKLEEEIRELRAKCEELSQAGDVATEQSSDDSVLEDFDSLRAARDQAATAAAEASRTIAELLAKAVEHERAAAERDEENRRLQEQLAAAAERDEENRKLQEQLAAAEEATEKLRGENATYRESVARLQADANALAEFEAARERERDEMEALRRALQATEAKREEAEATLTQLRQRLAAAAQNREQAEATEKQLAEMRAQVDTARRRLQDATQANADLVRELQSLKEGHAAVVKQAREASGQIPTLTQEKQRLEQGWAQSNNTISRLETSLAAARQKLLEMKTQQEQQQERLEQLEASLASVPENLREAGQLQREAKTLRVTVNNQLKSLSERDARLQDVAAKLSKARSDASTLRSELNEQKAVIRALRTQSEPEADVQNGRPAAGSAKPRAARGAKTSKADAVRVDARIGKVYDQRPAEIDDLKRINGIGKVLEKRLHSIGVYRFDQIKGWTNSIIASIDDDLTLRGRIQREDWVGQARELAKKSG